MCGIAGILPLKTGTDFGSDEPRIAVMLAAMRHRGPDDLGIVTTPLGTIGACRLAILGLEPASNQPLKIPDSDNTVVFNGEIFNYVEIRNDLQKLGHTFLSTGDTEVIAHAYEEWGQDCVRHFNGMFSLLVVDERRNRIFFARDRFGVKPFYFAIVRDSFVFASEMTGLLSSGLLQVQLDRHTAADYLKFGVTDHSGSTFIQGVNQLRPGHIGTIQGQALDLRKWYDPRDPMGKGAVPSPSDWVAAFRIALDRSVQLRLRSDVPVGVLLSGGVDSSGITSFFAGNPAARDLRCYCVGFPGSDYDETRYAEAVANHAGLPIEVFTAQRPTQSEIDECSRHLGEPSMSPSVLAQWMIMKSVHQSGTRVLLSGQGADECLAGYYIFDALAIRTYLATHRSKTAFRHMFHERNIARLPVITAQVVLLTLPTKVKALLNRKQWLRHENYHSEGDCAYVKQLENIRTLRDGVLFHLQFLLPQLLRYEDRNAMAFSIETRHPYLDYELVELALRAPEELLVSAGERKRLLRLSIANQVPSLVLARRSKIGLQTPQDWLRSPEFRAWYRDLVSEGPAELGDLIDFDAAGRLLDGGGSRARDNDAWRIFSLVLWYRQTFGNTATVTPTKEPTHTTEWAQLGAGAQKGADRRDRGALGPTIKPPTMKG